MQDAKEQCRLRPTQRLAIAFKGFLLVLGWGHFRSRDKVNCDSGNVGGSMAPSGRLKVREGRCILIATLLRDFRALGGKESAKRVETMPKVLTCPLPPLQTVLSLLVPDRFTTVPGRRPRRPKGLRVALCPPPPHFQRRMPSQCEGRCQRQLDSPQSLLGKLKTCHC